MSPSEAITPAGRVTHRPYWWDAGPGGAPLALEGLAAAPATAPERADAVVVGGGYTGLSAALTLARRGATTTVLEAEHMGFGCSARNGGLIGPSFHKLGLAGLKARHGEATAAAILGEAMEALGWLKDFIAEEGIDCGLRKTGRFRGALKPGDYDAFARQAEDLRAAVGLEFEMVPRQRQHDHIGSARYQGGVVYHQDGHLHPGLYLKGLAERAVAAGARLIAPARATAVAPVPGGFEVLAAGRRIRAERVLIATNGYTDPTFPYLRRRVLPMRSAIIATEPVPAALMDELSPKDQGFGEAGRLVIYYRPSPDRTRMVFGGRSFDLADRPENYVPDLKRLMCRIFPQLETVGLSHGWSGTVAYTFDHAPHFGEIPAGPLKGVFFSMGYCGSGVGRATWFGRKAALRMLGDPAGASPLEGLDFETRPLYGGHPWFLPAVLRWHSLLDRFGI